jgi:hypothetical protein
MHPKFKAMLRRCQENKYLIEFDRRPKIQGRIAGFVLGFNDSLILLHLLDWNTFTLNGFVVIRVQDINRQRIFDKKDYWQSKAARVKRLKPIRPGVSISSLEKAIVSASKAFALIAIEKELIAEGKMWIGKLAGFTKKTVSIRGLNPSAEWIKESKFNLGEITCLGFGGGYETALALSLKTLRNN